MKYIREYNHFKNKSIAVYHGLGGSPSEDRIEYLESIGFNNILYPHIDFENEWNLDKGKSLFYNQLDKIKNVDIILGFSLGGYLAFNLAGHLSKNLIMVNPAIDREKTKLDIKKFDILEKFDFSKIEIFFGENDTLVPRELAIKYLEKSNIDSTQYIIDGMEHRTPIDNFIEICNLSNIINL